MNTDTLGTAAPVEAAELVREYGPFAGSDCVNGVSFDGHHVWAATGAALVAFDPDSGDAVRTLALPCDAGTAFDGTHLYQIAGARIDRIDPRSGEVLASIPAPGGGTDSGMAWAEGSLWVGQYRQRRIHQVDPATGSILRTIASDRFVTGVTWVDGELWHGPTRRAERHPPHRPGQRRGAAPPADAGRTRRQWIGVRRCRAVLLRRRPRQGVRGEAPGARTNVTHSHLRGSMARLPPRPLRPSHDHQRLRPHRDADPRTPGVAAPGAAHPGQ